MQIIIIRRLRYAIQTNDFASLINVVRLFEPKFYAFNNIIFILRLEGTSQSTSNDDGIKYEHEHNFSVRYMMGKALAVLI